MRRVLALVWLLLVLGMGGHVASVARGGLPLQSDLMALLPREDQDPALQAAKDKVARSLADRVVVLIGHPERRAARAEAERLRQSLVAAGLLSPVFDIPGDAAVKRLGTVLFPHRAGLLGEADRRALLAERGESLATRALSQIFGFAGMADSRLLARDPFMLFPAFLGQLPVPANRLVLDDGWPSVTADGLTWVLLSGRLAGGATDLDFQRRFVQAVEGGAADRTPGYRVLRLGAVFFAEAGARQAMEESVRIGLFSLLGTIVLVVAVFRSFQPLLLAVAAIGVGLLAALSVCLAVFGSLHVAAQMFGASLIGIAVDYALLYFGQIFTPRTRPSERLAAVMPGMTLGMITTVIGYATLALSPFPGLKQVAVFSGIGLLASFLTVVLWFPLLERCGPRPLPPGLGRLAEGLWALWTERRRAGARRVLAGLALVLGLAGLARLETDDDVRRQQGLSPVLLAEQAEIQRLTGLGQPTRFFLVQGRDEEEALQRDEALGDRLGALGVSWQSPARFVPSARRQGEDAALVERTLLAPHLAAFRAQLGMTAAAEPAQPPGRPLTLADLRATGALPMLDALALDGATHMVAVDGAPAPEMLSRAADGIEGVRLIDPTGDINAVLHAYRLRAMGLLAVSAALMLPLLMGRYGRRGGALVMASALGAVVLAPLLLALLGVAFSFFGAMALVLVLSIATDYGVFAAEDRERRDSVTLVSVGLAMLTTLLSFGLLAFSAVAGVRAFGATMLVGVLLAFLLAPMGGGRRADRGPPESGVWSARFHSLRKPMTRLFVVLAVLCGACAAPMETPTDRVRVAPGLSLALPAPGDLGRTVEAFQMISARHGAETFTFEARLSVTSERVLMVGTDSMGRRALTLTWVPGRVAVERAAWLPEGLRPENILADMVMIFWPEAVLRRALDGAVRQSGHQRRIGDVIEVLWEGEPWSGTARLRNLAWDYELEIRSVTVAP
ncbi:conserved membrane hypothetical protein [Candidatus Terasakiella magnetica]|nr:conserved membrane hypothetical protein [Candidatus Terasakiella magnetica]